MSVNSSMFSGMKWLVRDDADAALRGLDRQPPPDDEVGLKWTTSGLTWSSTRAAFCLIRHGSAKRSQSCGYQRQLYSRCAVSSCPSCTSFHVPVPARRGAMTWTSWPRRRGPAASRSAKRAAPLTSGANVSAPMRMRSGRSASSTVTRGGVGHVVLYLAVRRMGGGPSRGWGRGRWGGISEHSLAPSSGLRMVRRRARVRARLGQIRVCGWFFASMNTPQPRSPRTPGTRCWPRAAPATPHRGR